MMKSMKCDMKERKEAQEAMVKCANPDAPKYPYGLVLYLDQESIEKLGLEKLPELGAKMKLEAIVEVCSLSESQNLYGDQKSLQLQITDMGLSAGKE